MKENQEKKQRAIVGQKVEESEMLKNDKINILMVITSTLYAIYMSFTHGYPGWFAFILNVMLYYLAPMILIGIYTLMKDLRQTGGINDAKTPLKV